MKHLLYTLLALLALTPLTSCRHDSEARPLSEITDASTADSLLYYYMQLRAYQYWQRATADTSLRSAEDRAKFLRGMRDGFDAYHPDDSVYNEGRRLGFRTALNIQEFERKYGVSFDRDVVFASMAYGLRDNADIPEFKYQKEFYRLLKQLNSRKALEESREARQTLAAQAKAHRLKEINGDLYFKVTHPGTGFRAERGDRVFVSVDYARTNGDDLGMPSPEYLTVGADGMPEVMTEALCRLNKGATGIFMTHARALFGDRAEILGLQGEAPIMITITLKEIIKEERREEI